MRMGQAESSGGTTLELGIDDLTREGDGVARHQGQVIFVPTALPGDRVRLRLIGKRRRQLLGRLEAITTASPDRRRPPCILANHCGGCSLQAYRDAAQQAWKQSHVAQCLQRLGGLMPPLRPLLAAADPLGYRNRAVIPLERLADGRLRAGYYRRGSHRIVNMNHCPVLDPRLDALIAPLKADLEAAGWPVDRHGLGLRHLALRIGQRSGELLITLIASDLDLPGLAPLAQQWMARWPDLVGVCLNRQPQPGNVLFGAETRVIAGRGWLLERFADLELRIAADTFFQVHTAQAERVVPLLREALGPASGLLLDIYCGIGTFSLPLAANGWSVLGLELQASAIALADRNAADNGLQQRARFRVGAAAAALSELLSAEPAVTALLVDPPRKGLEPAVLAAVRSQPPRRMAYLSCDPATLARDLGQLCGPEGPYQIDWIQPIDFFPNTSHVECLAALTRR
ncbi:MAG: 23S rRNA (uracil(1939)-C(5))-methyltransferase RlmD [Synechococcaceae cyanobacterium]|nr:23S rRNA (uracil(1939)-C(5))-methyltransferase RlmD [Synechococcaceae cyanobacterium]